MLNQEISTSNQCQLTMDKNSKDKKFKITSTKKCNKAISNKQCNEKAPSKKPASIKKYLPATNVIPP